MIEVQFGSLSSSIDSDGDGCVDFEEWILRTDPIARPAPAPAYAARVFSYLIPSSPEPLVRIGIAACAPNNDLAWLNQTQLVVLLGNQMGGALVDMRDLAFGDPDGIEITPGSLPGTLVAKLSFAAPLSQMLAFAPFSVGGGAVSGPTGTRDSVYFDVIGSAFGFYAMQSVTTPPGGSGSTASAAFTPLDPGGPVGWGSLGDACVLTMQSSGTSGPCVLAEVTGAACLPYPAYCEGGACAQKLGSVHLLLDVLSIIAN
ncbi:MAG TPA: hypothetical protein VFI25_14555 [Planctomycetota bacterium]|nr:hypothetical protein [Planctomycetota bacterium]